MESKILICPLCDCKTSGGMGLIEHIYEEHNGQFSYPVPTVHIECWCGEVLYAVQLAEHLERHADDDGGMQAHLVLGRMGQRYALYVERD